MKRQTKKRPSKSPRHRPMAPKPRQALQVIPSLPEKIERVLLEGDLSGLTPDERVQYYRAVCKSLRLNPLTRPLEYVKINNPPPARLILYARRDCADQLRALYNVKIQIVKEEERDGLRLVYVRASLPNGRMDEDIGVVSIKGLAGDALANALMKASTKAKRRVTLSICGLGLLDETELETIHASEPGTGAPALRSEDVMPRRKLPEGDAELRRPDGSADNGEAQDRTAPHPAGHAPVQTGHSTARPNVGAVASEGVAPSSPSPQTTLPLGHVQPALPAGAVTVEINGQLIVTGGITKSTLLKAYKMGAQLDELTRKGQAKELLGREFSLEHRHELTEEAGQKYVAALAKFVNRALEQRR